MGSKALAVAYAVKRRNQKKMSKGGLVAPKLEAATESLGSDELASDEAYCAHGGPVSCEMGCYDEGGEVGVDGYSDTEDPMTSDVSDQKRFDQSYAPSAPGKLLSRILGSIGNRHK